MPDTPSVPSSPSRSQPLTGKAAWDRSLRAGGLTGGEGSTQILEEVLDTYEDGNTGVWIKDGVIVEAGTEGAVLVDLTDGLSQAEQDAIKFNDDSQTVHLMEQNWVEDGGDGVETDNVLELDEQERAYAAISRYADAHGISYEQAQRIYFESTAFSRQNLREQGEARQATHDSLLGQYETWKAVDGHDQPGAFLTWAKETFGLEDDDPVLLNLQAYMEQPHDPSLTPADLISYLQLNFFAGQFQEEQVTIQTDANTAEGNYGLALANAIPLRTNIYRGDYGEVPTTAFLRNDQPPAADEPATEGPAEESETRQAEATTPPSEDTPAETPTPPPASETTPPPPAETTASSGSAESAETNPPAPPPPIETPAGSETTAEAAAEEPPATTAEVSIPEVGPDEYAGSLRFLESLLRGRPGMTIHIGEWTIRWQTSVSGRHDGVIAVNGEGRLLGGSYLRGLLRLAFGPDDDSGNVYNVLRGIADNFSRGDAPHLNLSAMVSAYAQTGRVSIVFTGQGTPLTVLAQGPQTGDSATNPTVPTTPTPPPPDVPGTALGEGTATGTPTEQVTQTTQASAVDQEVGPREYTGSIRQLAAIFRNHPTLTLQLHEWTIAWEEGQVVAFDDQGNELEGDGVRRLLRWAFGADDNSGDVYNVLRRLDSFLGERSIHNPIGDLVALVENYRANPQSEIVYNEGPTANPPDVPPANPPVPPPSTPVDQDTQGTGGTEVAGGTEDTGATEGSEIAVNRLLSMAREVMTPDVHGTNPTEANRCYHEALALLDPSSARYAEIYNEYQAFLRTPHLLLDPDPNPPAPPTVAIAAPAEESQAPEVPQENPPATIVATTEPVVTTVPPAVENTPEVAAPTADLAPPPAEVIPQPVPIDVQALRDREAQSASIPVVTPPPPEVPDEPAAPTGPSAEVVEAPQATEEPITPPAEPAPQVDPDYTRVGRLLTGEELISQGVASFRGIRDSLWSVNDLPAGMYDRLFNSIERASSIMRATEYVLDNPNDDSPRARIDNGFRAAIAAERTALGRAILDTPGDFSDDQAVLARLENLYAAYDVFLRADGSAVPRDNAQLIASYEGLGENIPNFLRARLDELREQRDRVAAAGTTRTSGTQGEGPARGPEPYSPEDVHGDIDTRANRDFQELLGREDYQQMRIGIRQGYDSDTGRVTCDVTSITVYDDRGRSRTIRLTSDVGREVQGVFARYSYLRRAGGPDRTDAGTISIQPPIN